MAVQRLDEMVRLAVYLGRRGQGVPACRPEVQVVSGKMAVVLARPAEVGVQPGAAELAERREPVPSRAVLVDVEHVGFWRAGRDGQVPALMVAEPSDDLPLVGGGIQEAAAGGGIFRPGYSRRAGLAEAGLATFKLIESAQDRRSGVTAPVALVGTGHGSWAVISCTTRRALVPAAV